MNLKTNIEQEIRCGKFLYRLTIYANAGLPISSVPDESLGAEIPASIGEGLPVVLIAHPPNESDQTKQNEAGDLLPEDRVRLALVWISPDARGESGAASVDPGPVIGQIQTMLLSSQAVSPAIEGLGELATTNGLQIQASVIELAAGGVGEAGGLDDQTLERILPKRFHAALAEERAREATLAYVQVCTAGLPPLVHVHLNGIIFPVRSWVPAGLYPEWQPLCQSIECEVGDRLVVHTELTARVTGLKLFHESLQQQGSGDWSLFQNVGDGPVATSAALELRIEPEPETK